MEHFILILKKRSFPTILLLICFAGFALPAEAQHKDKHASYEILPAPDLWYNDVDGIRVGARLIGQVPGTFEDGPHRLDLGVWLATWFPDYPVSYYVTFTEPIPSISDFGSEGNIKLLSSIRTGFHQHGLSFNKRWQTGFEEKNYKEFSLGFNIEKRFEDEYALYPQLWQDNWLYLLKANFMLSDEDGLGRYIARTSNAVNVGGHFDSFINSRVSFMQYIPLSEYFQFRARVFMGASSNKTAPEYLFGHSFKSARGWMNKGLTRAKGTIPVPWMEEGIIQVAGGANLRGYVKQDFENMNYGLAPVYTSMGSLNLEFDYPNPLDRAIQKVPVIGGIAKLRSYLFMDTGTSLGISDYEEDRVLSDAGLGFMFSLNIPDYLGKPRGIVLRYDIPLWLSHPGGSDKFKYRNVIGIGAVIAL